MREAANPDGLSGIVRDVVRSSVKVVSIALIDLDLSPLTLSAVTITVSSFYRTYS